VNAVRQAFDRHASVYDQVFSNSTIRSEVWEIADRVFSPGMHLLDLGCGTGEDAIHFADRGLNVTAIDIAPLMIARLRSKGAGSIRCEESDMRAYAPANERVDAVFSNFGALNCVPDVDWLRELPLAPGAHLVLTVMGRLYPLETAVFLLRGKPGLAFRRFGHRSEAVVEGVRFDIYYHGLRALQKGLGPKFDLMQVRGLRSIVPSPNLAHLDRFDSLRRLQPLDRWLCSRRLTATWADHFVSVWRYREE
jgi:SAM-dependent methyltransferase